MTLDAVCQNAQGAQGIRLDHQFKGARANREVADQHRRGRAPDQVRPLPCRRRISEPSTMSSCSRVAVWMNSTEAASFVAAGDVAPCPDSAGGGDGQQRTQALAARRDQMLGQQRDHRHVGLHPGDDQGVNRRHVVLRQTNKSVHIALGAGSGDESCVHENLFQLRGRRGRFARKITRIRLLERDAAHNGGGVMMGQAGVNPYRRSGCCGIRPSGRSRASTPNL